MSGGGNTTSTTSTEAPAWLRPSLQNAANLATIDYQSNPMAPYQGPRTAPQSPQTQQAKDTVTQRATGGSPVVGAGQNFIEAGLSRPAAPVYTANSNMFGAASNPYQDAMFSKAALATGNQLSSEFARSGRNVGATQGLRGQQLNDLATSIYGGGYEAERQRMAAEQGQNQAINAGAAENAAQRQQGLLGYGIPYANQDYTDAQQLASVGAAQDRYGQQLLNDQRDLYNETAGIPGQKIDDYIRRLTGFMGSGGTVTQSQPSNSNPLGSALGGAAAGSAFGPWGALGGGLLGGIFG